MYFYNGQLHQHSTLELSIDHPALLYGASVFTTLRVYGSLEARLTQWPAHCQRLVNSLATFGWTLPDWTEVKAGALAMIEAYSLQNSSGLPILRVTVFPDGAVLITERSLPKDLERRQQQGITAQLAEPTATGDLWSRSLPGHKTGNYLVPWLALQQLRWSKTNSSASHPAKEVILVNEQGDWLETCTGNLWGWSQGRWYTPPLASGILPGVAREALRQHLLAQCREVVEIPWESALVEQLQVLAYSNCVVEVVPIHEVKFSATQTAFSGKQKLEYDPLHPALGDLRHFFSETDAE